MESNQIGAKQASDEPKRQKHRGGNSKGVRAAVQLAVLNARHLIFQDVDAFTQVLQSLQIAQQLVQPVVQHGAVAVEQNRMLQGRERFKHRALWRHMPQKPRDPRLCVGHIGAGGFCVMRRDKGFDTVNVVFQHFYIGAHLVEMGFDQIGDEGTGAGGALVCIQFVGDFGDGIYVVFARGDDAVLVESDAHRHHVLRFGHGRAAHMHRFQQHHDAVFTHANARAGVFFDHGIND